MHQLFRQKLRRRSCQNFKVNFNNNKTFFCFDCRLLFTFQKKASCGDWNFFSPARVSCDNKLYNHYLNCMNLVTHCLIISTRTCVSRGDGKSPVITGNSGRGASFRRAYTETNLNVALWQKISFALQIRFDKLCMRLWRRFWCVFVSSDVLRLSYFILIDGERWNSGIVYQIKTNVIWNLRRKPEIDH